jgi:muconate cycloisomerase
MMSLSGYVSEAQFLKMPKIAQIEIFKTDIPFRMVFKHSLKKRATSESIFVKVTLEDKTAGFGEALPRAYVTGRTQDSVFQDLVGYAPRLIGQNIKDTHEGILFLKDLRDIDGEARCALEIALIDSAGKFFKQSLAQLLGGALATRFSYSAVFSGESLLKMALMSAQAKRHKFKFIKVKVGLKNDVSRLRLCRFILKDADLRVDANGAWNKNEALMMIEEFRPFNISCIEQPTPKNDIKSLAEIARVCPEPIIADESLCTPDDARTLACAKACDIFNVRLSKCGGIFKSLEIIKIAKEYGLGYQIGCHVGESGILSAAGRHLAAVANNAKYLEGSYSRIILK